MRKKLVRKPVERLLRLIELRSRFWLGWHIIGGKPVKILPDEEMTPLIKPKMLLAHNMKEFTNLARLLPQIYPEQKDNWD